MHKFILVLWLAVPSLAGKGGSQHKIWKTLRANGLDEHEVANDWYDECGVSKYDDATEGEPVSPQIVGGSHAREGELPWQAGLYISNYHVCGGVLIDERWVLTAAHCLEDSGNYKVILGDHDITQIDYAQQEFTVSAADICIHANQSVLPWAYDIAMIRLQRPAVINEDVRPACRPDVNDDVTGVKCTVSGWGETEPKAMAGKSPILQYVNVPVVNWTECVATYADVRDIYDTNMCAGYPEGEADACYGDSGGPLVCQRDGNFTLFGIVSWGEGCARPDRPGVYTRVQSFLGWIDNIRQRYDEPNVC